MTAVEAQRLLVALLPHELELRHESPADAAGDTAILEQADFADYLEREQT